MQKFLTKYKILFLVLIICSILYYGYREKVISEKPVLKYKLLNGWPGMRIEELYLINDVLREQFTLKEVKDGYDLVIDNIGEEKITNPKSVKIFFTGEAVHPKIDGYDISIGFDYIDSPNYIRIPLYFMYYGPKLSTNYRRGDCNPHKEIFACFLVSNEGRDPKFDGCKARNRIFHKLSLYKKVESGGRYLTTTGGPIEAKMTQEWLSKCKFVIAYENRSYEGYITEKPFQAYFTGAIPIYYGHTSTMRDLNPEAIINARDFATEDNLVDYISKIDNDDQLYCDIWNKQIITNHDQSYDAIRERFKTKLDAILRDKKLIK